MPYDDTPRLCAQCESPFTPHPGDPGLFCSRECYTTARQARAIATREPRFWSYVNRTDHCWLWSRSTSGRGYGQFTVGHGHNVLAHRAAWQFATGETLVRADVIGHVCDTPLCVRNDDAGTYEVNGLTLPRRGHLFKGTSLDNNRDMYAKGRAVSRQILADSLEREVADTYTRSADLTQDQIGALYGVSQSVISRIVVQHHPQGARRVRPVSRGERNPCAKLTEDNVQQIRTIYAAGGITQADLGQQFGISQAWVSKIVLRQKWNHVE